MSIHALHASLQHETGLLDQFIAALEAEAENLLAPGGNDALNESTRIKSELAEQLSLAGQARDALLAGMDLGEGKAGLEGAAQNHPETRALVAILFERAERARQVNASNGYIIETYLKYNQQALDTLRSLAGIGNLYDASGRARNTSAQTRGIRAG
jgi:flagella synthesis protein FlgN